MEPKPHLTASSGALGVRNHYLACFCERFMLRLIPQLLRSSEIQLFEGRKEPLDTSEVSYRARTASNTQSFNFEKDENFQIFPIFIFLHSLLEISGTRWSQFCAVVVATDVLGVPEWFHIMPRCSLTLSK